MTDRTEKSMNEPRSAGRRRPGPDLRSHDLRGASMLGAALEGADLRGADLRGADLRGADLFGARLEGADLRAARLDMGRLIEIRIPRALELELVNQIRAFDFSLVMTRFVGPNRRSEELPCPYRDAALAPLLYEWGSRTWNGGRGWNPPERIWTLEEIIASVLDALGARHDLERPWRTEVRPARSGASC